MSKSAYHDSGRSYVTGSAEYVDDRPLVHGEVFVDVFYSPIAYGKIKSLDTSGCLNHPDVLAVYTATQYVGVYFSRPSFSCR
jgi:xanthine dehydrogenase large subunit